MSGRADYEERKQMKKERYEELADKARQKSQEQYNKHNRISNMIPMGQPILTDHYSANRHRNDIKKMNRAIEKSIEEDKKADYYEGKVDNIDNSKVISSDDPQAIQKLEAKLKTLEDYKAKVKARPHKAWELQNLNQQMKSIKDRIQQLKELDSIEFEDISFKGGKVVHNKEINRIQILFDDIPDEDTRNLLKSHAFKWSRYEKAWQRLFNKNGIYAAKCVIEKIESKGD